MNISKALIVLVLACTIASCQKVIKVDLETAAPMLVVDASINWEKHSAGNNQRIKLSTTTGYYNPDFPTVSGATIFITNTAGAEFDFAESTISGEYVCADFVPVVGETYELTVTLNGETYKAVETLIRVPEIDESITQSSTGGMTGDEMEIQYSFLDGGDQDDYYMAGVTFDRLAYPEYNLESDEMFQGQRMTQYYSHEKELKAGDVVNINLYGVSKRFYDYFRKILAASGADTGPFPTTPTAVRGNILNQTNPGKDALGYFRLSEVSTRTYTIQ